MLSIVYSIIHVMGPKKDLHVFRKVIFGSEKLLWYLHFIEIQVPATYFIIIASKTEWWSLDGQFSWHSLEPKRYREKRNWWWNSSGHNYTLPLPLPLKTHNFCYYLSYMFMWKRSPEEISLKCFIWCKAISFAMCFFHTPNCGGGTNMTDQAKAKNFKNLGFKI